MAQLLHLTGRAVTDANGNPYPAAVAHFYLPGTTTAVDTYTTAALSVANANPVVSDASTGIFPAIYLAAKRYKVVIKDASANTLQTWEVVDTAENLIVSASAPSPTYPLLRYANSSDGHTYRRNLADNAWIDEGAVDSLLNAASVTETLAATETGKATTPDSVGAIWQRGSNITPSGGVVSLPAGGGGVFNIAAGNFSSISSAVGGRTVIFVFSGTSVITYNATSMVLPGGASLTSEAGDCACFVNEAATDASGSNWRCVWYQRDSTTLAPPINYAATQTEVEAIASALRWLTPANANWHPGVAKGWVNFTVAAAIDESHNVTSITDTSAAKWAIVWATDFGAGTYCCVTGSEATANNETAVDTMTGGGTNVKMYRSDDTNTAETNSVASHVAAFGDQA